MEMLLAAIAMGVVLFFAFIVYRYRKLIHRLTGLSISHDALKNKYRELKASGAVLEKQEKLFMAGRLNFLNALKYIAEGKGKYISYVHDLKEGQAVCVVYCLQNPFLADMTSSTGGLMSYDLLQHITRQPAELDCVVFIDGREVSPFPTEYVSDSDTEFRFDIDISRFSGRGLGTLIMKDLIDFLRLHTKVERVKGKLSPVDFDRRDRLYNFYEKCCGFTLTKHMTEESPGSVLYEISRP